MAQGTIAAFDIEHVQSGQTEYIGRLAVHNRSAFREVLYLQSKRALRARSMSDVHGYMIPGVTPPRRSPPKIGQLPVMSTRELERAVYSALSRCSKSSSPSQARATLDTLFAKHPANVHDLLQILLRELSVSIIAGGTEEDDADVLDLSASNAPPTEDEERDEDEDEDDD